MKIRIRKTDPSATLPAYATDGAAGMDLCAAEDGMLVPGARRAIPTGIAIELPPGLEAQVRPRSGLARDYGIAMVNAPGTIDWDYRGQIHVLLVNLGTEPWHYRPGDRIAQLVIAPIARVELEVVEELSETARGERGFGSTGIRDLHVGPPMGTVIRGADLPDMGPELVGIPLPEGPITCAVGCAEGHCIGMGAEGCHGRGLTP